MQTTKNNIILNCIGHVVTALLCLSYSFFFYAIWLFAVSATTGVKPFHNAIIILYSLVQLGVLFSKRIPLRFKFLVHLFIFVSQVVVIYLFVS